MSGETGDTQARTLERIEDVIERNKAKFTIYRSSPKTLLLDLDTPHAEEAFERTRPIYAEMVGGFDAVEEYRSRNGNVHVVITLAQPIHDTQRRYYLQAAMGSDEVKEALSLKRVWMGQHEPSILFRPRTRT